MNIQAVNLNLLLTLDALLVERNVTRAARRLGLTQPAVSNALSQLRSALHDPLLVRGPHGMTPTERALALAGPLRAALSTLETALLPTPAFEPRTADRTFAIATTDFVAFVLLPRLLAKLRQEAPQIRLRVLAWPYHRVPPTLESGEIDLMMGFYPRVPASHRAQRLFDDRFVCVVRRNHPTVQKKLSLKQYLSLQHVLVSHDDNSPGVVDTVLSKRGLRRDVALRLPHFLLVPSVIAGSDMVAALSERVAVPFSKQVPLQLLPPPLSIPVGWVGQVWHERTHHSPAHIWLRQKIAEASEGL